MNLKDFDPSNMPFRGLFIGRSGSGKDTAAISFPGKTFIFDLDRRIRGILDIPWLKERRDKGDYEFVSYDARKGFKDIDNQLQLLIAAGSSKATKQYDNIIFDSLTSLRRFILTETFRLLPPKSLISMSQKALGAASGKIDYSGIVQLPDQPHYRVTNEGIMQVVYEGLVTLSAMYNVFMTAHVVPRYAKPTGDENKFAEMVEDGEKLSVPDGVGEGVMLYFDEVYKFEKEESGITNTPPKHYVKFRTDIAKTAITSLPNGRTDITGKNFYDIWRGFQIK